MSDRARHLLVNPKLAEISDITRFGDHILQSLARYEGLRDVIDFVRLTRDVLQDGDERLVEEVLTERLLAPSTDDKLFEIIAGFALVDAFVQSGFQEHTVRLLGDNSVPFARMRLADTRASIWWQRSIWRVEPDLCEGCNSYFHDVLRAAGMRRSSLRPDFLVVLDHPLCVLLVEVKHTALEDVLPDRRGVLEAMAYVQDSREVLAGLPEPYALVVAWNAEGSPGTSPIVVADQNQVSEAIGLVLREWGVVEGSAVA